MIYVERKKAARRRLSGVLLVLRADHAPDVLAAVPDLHVAAVARPERRQLHGRQRLQGRWRKGTKLQWTQRRQVKGALADRPNLAVDTNARTSGVRASCERQKRREKQFTHISLHEDPAIRAGAARGSGRIPLCLMPRACSDAVRRRRLDPAFARNSQLGRNPLGLCDPRNRPQGQ